LSFGDYHSLILSEGGSFENLKRANDTENDHKTKWKMNNIEVASRELVAIHLELNW
jgi:hypothetical protein